MPTPTLLDSALGENIQTEINDLNHNSNERHNHTEGG